MALLALKLVLPWLTAQELTAIAATCSEMAAAVGQITRTRVKDAAQGKERWTVPIINDVDACVYPYFVYTRRSFVFSPSHPKCRAAWGSVEAESSQLQAGSLDAKKEPSSVLVKEWRRDGEHEWSVFWHSDNAVGCKCSGDCLGFAERDGSGVRLHEESVSRTRKRKKVKNLCPVGNLAKEQMQVPNPGSCPCGRMFGGQTAYDGSSRLRILVETEVSVIAGSSDDEEDVSEEDREVDDGPPLLMECGAACSCSSSCGQRVSQQGLGARVSILRSPLKGWCLHAAQVIRAGSFVCEYAGELLTTVEARRRQRIYEGTGGTKGHGPSLLILKEHLPSGQACLRLNVDGTSVGNVARFISHSCDGGNLYPCLIRAAGSIVPKLGFFAKRNIAEGEEISFSYGADATSTLGYRFCFCGTAACRGMLPSEPT